ncbi:MAG TPA: hypothetical protein P5121_30700 [Caldilineaceae bacterium]|nr:hypothetical protein [Caldilineaceae bacterium]HRW09525.1 hypothetical protein [Caldilineaceae bacterium]
MNRVILHRTIRQFRQQFLMNFQRVTENDLHAILAESSEMLLMVLATRYGYTRDDAIGAWNEFVLRHVDGQPVKYTDMAVPCPVSAL